MICPECNGTGETNYYVEVDRDENSVTVARRKDICRTCNGSGEKPMTNADRIRAMSDEELAEFLCGICDNYYDDDANEYFAKFIEGDMIIDYDEDKLLEWLRQPAEVDNA